MQQNWAHPPHALIWRIPCQGGGKCSDKNSISLRPVTLIPFFPVYCTLFGLTRRKFTLFAEKDSISTPQTPPPAVCPVPWQQKKDPGSAPWSLHLLYTQSPIAVLRTRHSPFSLYIQKRPHSSWSFARRCPPRSGGIPLPYSLFPITFQKSRIPQVRF